MLIMRKISFMVNKTTIFLLLLFASVQASAQNVGIGTTTPKARLHVVDSAVVFTGPSSLPPSPGLPPISGAGLRMMWYPQKAAFRTGEAYGDEWDFASIGVRSTALGSGNKAMGQSSFSVGDGNVSSGYASSTLGGYNTASSYAAVAMGFGNQSSGYYATTMGESVTAKSRCGVAIGSFNDIGDNPSATSPISTDRLFQIGNGSSNGRSNAVTVLRNGNTGFGLVEPAAKIDISKGRIRFTGDPSVGFSQGIEFTNVAGTANNGFIGTYNDSMMGFYGYTGAYWKMLFNNTNGNLGLQGNNNPRAALSFANTVGNKIALWGDADSDHYGLGIQGGKLQIYGSGTNADIVLGYGRSNAFTENMIVKGTGNVGIGTSNPTEKLEVAGNLKTGGLITAAIMVTVGTPAVGKVLTGTNALGNALWKDLPTKNSGFHASLPGMSVATGVLAYIDNNNADDFDDGLSFNNNIHKYVCGTPGVYQFSFDVSLVLSSGSATSGVFEVMIQRNNSNIYATLHNFSAGPVVSHTMTGTVTIKLAYGDAISIYSTASNVNTQVNLFTSAPGSFSGHRIY